MYDSTQDTLKHIRRVQELLAEAAWNLSERAIYHDKSKLESPEKEAFDAVGPNLKDLTYGSDEYNAAKASLGTALQHHYESNPHHPEHWENGVNDMSIFDIHEMLLDWIAASERHSDGNIRTSIDINTSRFGLSPQLKQIMLNTVEELGL